MAGAGRLFSRPPAHRLRHQRAHAWLGALLPCLLLPLSGCAYKYQDESGGWRVIGLVAMSLPAGMAPQAPAQGTPAQGGAEQALPPSSNQPSNQSPNQSSNPSPDSSSQPWGGSRAVTVRSLGVSFTRSETLSSISLGYNADSLIVINNNACVAVERGLSAWPGDRPVAHVQGEAK